MRIVLLSLGAFIFAGCAPVNERMHGSWLESVGRPAAAPVQMSPEEAQSLRAQAQALGLEGEALRQQLAAQPDRVRRIEILEQLRDVGDRLRPIQQTLRQGGFPAPAAPLPPRAEG